MPVLSKSDWAEIYYAVSDKLESPLTQPDGTPETAGWREQLQTILDEIGPDGEQAYTDLTDADGKHAD